MEKIINSFFEIEENHNNITKLKEIKECIKEYSELCDNDNTLYIVYHMYIYTTYIFELYDISYIFINIS
jgi:hypothetical protein